MALSPNVVVVAPGELITADHLNNIRANLDRLDTSKVNDFGDVMTGPLETTGLSVTGNAGVSGGLTVNGQIGTGSVLSNGPVQVGGLPWTNQKAVYIDNVGTIFAYMADPQQGNASLQLARSGLSGATGQAFTYYQRAATSGGAPSIIGAVTVASGTTVSFVTTSDKRLKTMTRPVDPDEAVDKLAAAEPVNFTWTDSPADGEQLGFFAQDLYTVCPEAVTPGRGEPGDVADPDDPTSVGFVPWMVDTSKLVPTLVAAVQALTRRIQTLEEQLGATS